MPFDVLRLDLRLRVRMLIGTAVGAAAYLFLIVVMYPSFKSDSSLDDMIAANPGAAAAFGISDSITTPSGWLSANMLVNIGPLLALLLTIGYGAAAIAGQNTDGFLGTIVTLPLGRTRLLAEKVGALIVSAAVVPAAAFLAVLPGPHYDLTPNWGALASVCFGLGLLAFDLGAMALLIGAVTSSRGLSLGLASAVAAATYLISSLSPMIDWVHDIRWASPFYWSVGNNQVAHGVDATSFALLIGLGIVLVAAAVPALRRLDIS